MSLDGDRFSQEEIPAVANKGRVLDVECQCGELLFEYFKAGRGRLIKCYLSEIQDDRVGVVDLPLSSRPTCPGCRKEIGIVRIVRGRPALKLNQGAVQKIRI
jgi:hypothetical protein